MPKLVISLTDSKIKSAISMQKKSFEKNIKLSDGGGLYLLLDRKGGAYWRFDYIRPISKKRATIAIGIYPSCTLARARAKRSEFRELLAQNIDPAIQKQDKQSQCRKALLHKDLKCKAPLIEPNLRRNLGKWST